MYLRRSTVRKNGKTHTYWRLVRSVRVGGKVRQETVASLGELDAKGRAKARALAEAICGDAHQRRLFDDVGPSESVTVRLDAIRLERGRRFGDVWLGWTLWRALRFDTLLAELLPPGREDVPWPSMAAVLVVTRGGLPLSYEVFDGNRTDVTTVEEMVEAVEAKHGRARRIWVMDRGMTSQTNLAFLRQDGRQYVLGTARAELKRFEPELLEKGWTEVREGVEVKLCPGPDGQETFILCRSADRREKEKAMHDRFAQRIENDLGRLDRRLERAGQPAEAAFRIHKSDLSIRPIWHQRADRVQAHILVCFLAYVLWKTLEQWQSRAGLGNSPAHLLDELRRLQSTDVVLPTTGGPDLRLRCVVRPDKAQVVLLDHLGLTVPQRLQPPRLLAKM